MPVIGLVRLRRAFGGETPCPTQSTPKRETGRHGNGNVGDYVIPVDLERVKIPNMGCLRRYNIFPTGGLLRAS